MGEVGLSGLAISSIPLLPRRTILQLSRALGAAAFMVSRRLRRIALANIDAAFGPALSSGDKRKIARESFRTAALTILDIFWFSRHSEKRIQRFFRIAPSAEPYFSLTPLVLLAAHYGNWEVLGKGLALRGRAPTSVARPLKNRFIDRFLNRAREGTGQRITPRKGALRVLLRSLREGDPVALLVDQNTQPQEGGAFVCLFGLQAPITKAPAALASRAAAHLLFIFCTADDAGIYTAEALDPVSADTVAEWGEDATQRIADLLEATIRRRPGQWFWMYKRWKAVPIGEPMDRYPFYAKRMEP